MEAELAFVTFDDLMAHIEAIVSFRVLFVVWTHPLTFLCVDLREHRQASRRPGFCHTDQVA